MIFPIGKKKELISRDMTQIYLVKDLQTFLLWKIPSHFFVLDMNFLFRDLWEASLNTNGLLSNNPNSVWDLFKSMDLPTSWSGNFSHFEDSLRSIDLF